MCNDYDKINTSLQILLNKYEHLIVASSKEFKHDIIQDSLLYLFTPPKLTRQH